MSEIPGSKMWYGSSENVNDLDTDAVPGCSTPTDESDQSAACQQTEPSSTTCSGETSCSNPMDQRNEIPRRNEANCSATFQNLPMIERPDEYSNLGSNNFQTTELTRQQLSQTDDIYCHKRSLIEKCLPPELKQQHFDILIIYALQDNEAAKNLKRIIEELYAENFNGERTPITVGLWEEVALYVRNNVDWLDAALNCCTYIFVIFTQHLINDDVLSEMTKASLWATFSEEKKNKFCPVYLEKGAKEALKLSVYINVLSSVNMWRDASIYKALVAKYIDVAPRIERCRRQDEEAKQYCDRQIVAYSTSAEDTTDYSSRIFHMNEISFAQNSQQPHSPVPSSVTDSGFFSEKVSPSPTTSTSENSIEHSSPVDFKSCPITRECFAQNSLMPGGGMSKENMAADWQRNCLLMTIGAVIGVGIVYLFKK